MTAYAVAHLRSVDYGDAIAEYLTKIDDTVRAFDGRFLVHGTDPHVLEGEWPGHLVLIEFPDLERARGWYDSPEYQEILPAEDRELGRFGDSRGGDRARLSRGGLPRQDQRAGELGELRIPAARAGSA
ncbi:DUF1330 domain-containing protein [Rhodococcus sp. 7Tela_A2]|uniref:DUF1330 domain-containing protein n=1 Tax=Rhodococcus sp. 7Tela_A2 TaxID=3093744 RepID=UPI003BB716FC